MKRTLLRLLASAMLLGGYCLAQTTFYVAPGGSDSRTDTQGQNPSTPFKTPNRVQTAIHDLGTCNSSRGAITVYFKTGPYYLGNSSTNPTGTWVISGTDTCSASPITYSNWVVGGVAQDAGVPILSGGIQLGRGMATWATHTTSSGATLWSTSSIPLSATGSFSPEALYYQVAGSGAITRRFRTRSSATSGNLVGTFPLSGASEPNGRIPNPQTTTYDHFTYTSGDWPDTVAAAANYSCWNPSSQSGNSCMVTTEPIYGGDIEVLAFEDWTMARERISYIDTSAHVVYLLGSTKTSSGHGYMQGHRYMIENYISRDGNGLPILLPGQFFIDRSNATLYYMPNSGETPSSDSVILPVLSANGTSGALLAATDIQYVTFQNLTFQNDNYAPPQGGYAPAQSDVALPAMITCLDCSHVTFTGDIFTQTTGHALEFQTDQSSATPTANVINGNYFYNLGGDGLMYGGMPQNGDSGTNILGNGQIESNLVQGYGRMYAGSSGIEHPFGYDTTIINNDVDDGYQTGIGICIPNGSINCGGTTGGGSAYGIAANYNHVWNIGKGVTDDMGAMYIATYGAGSSSNRNQIRNNWLHDVNDAQVLDTDGYGGNGVYIDNTTGNIDVENNLVYRVTSHAYQNTQGPFSTSDPNYVNNNIFSYARVGMIYEGAGSSGTPNALTTTLSNNIFYFDGNGTRSSCESQEQDTKFCTFTIQVDCTVLNTTTSFSNASQQYSENIYYNPYSGNSGWASTGAFFTVTAPNPGPPVVLCPKSSTYTFTNWQNLYSSPKQDANSVAYSYTNTNPFKHPYCTDSTPDACLKDSTKQDDYSQASGFTIPTTFTFFNANLAGRQSGGTYPLCPTWAACPASVIDTFPTSTFSLTSTGTNVLTSY